MAYIVKEDLLAEAKAKQGGVFAAPVIVRLIQKAPEIDIYKLGKWNITEDFGKCLKIPTADVVEVKHGYWKEPKGGGYQCSNCRAFFDDYYGFSAKEKCIYCPTCGAKMDLKEGATNDT